jgi:hypothetical protein
VKRRSGRILASANLNNTSKRSTGHEKLEEALAVGIGK